MTKVVTLNLEQLFGRNLKRILREKNMSQVALAKKMKVSKQAINAVARGARGMRFKKIEKLCAVLEIKPKQLFEEGEPDPAEILDKVINRMFERMQSTSLERRTK